MLSKIHIENFKSLRNVTLELQPVNLLIGPNNSGKTNFLKALEFLRRYRTSSCTVEEYFQNTYKHIAVEILLTVEGFAQSHSTRLVWDEKQEAIIRTRFYNGEEENYTPSHNLSNLIASLDTLGFYRPNPLKFTESQAVPYNNYINEDASNIVPFLDTLRERYKGSFAAIEEDLRKCIPEFHDFHLKIENTFTNKQDKRTFLKWGLYSKSTKMTYWADELSEGVLYFVALLCIIHQPNPPKILLLEEPERGIHPRRIKEVVDFIFNLAQTKDVQVIMTSHHPYVLNEFEDIPEAVFVFDKDEEGATQIRNLQKDIIVPSDTKNDALGLPRIKFTQDLAEHWFSGFLGGVPA